MSEPISFKIARLSGLFQEDSKQFLRPRKNSGIAELFGHTKEHNRQAFVKPANKAETEAFVCGGSSYTLGHFASVLGYSLDDFENGTIPSPVPLKKNETAPAQFYKQHSKETPLEGLYASYFKYFKEHGIEDPKKLLKQFNAYFTTLETGEFKEKGAFVFPLNNGSFKFFILDWKDLALSVVAKRMNAGGTDTLFPSKDHDLGGKLYIFEGFPDCLKARELGYNAFTWSGGVQSFDKLAKEFEKGKEVFLVLDQDQHSQKALPKVAQAFLDEGFSVKVVDLPFTESEKEKKEKDFCDWMKAHNKAEFDELLGATYFYQGKQEEPDPTGHDYVKREISELTQMMASLKQRQAYIYSAPTGSGKTFTLCKNTVTLALESEEQFTYFCSTTAEAANVKALIENLLLEASASPSLVDLIISDNDSKDYDAPILVTTYAYLGRYGHTAKPYPNAKKLLERRHLIYDEVQELLRYMTISYPLRARYLQKGKDLYLVDRCPKTSTKGDCSTCFLGYARRELSPKENERAFYPIASKTAFQEYSQQSPLPFDLLQDSGFSSWTDLENPEKYERVNGMLSFKSLKKNIRAAMSWKDEDYQTDDSEAGHLKSLLLGGYKPEIRIQFPLKDGSPCVPSELPQEKAEDKKNVNYPVATCTVPTLCDIDLMPIRQTFKYAKSVIFTSATIPNELIELIQEAGRVKNWAVELAKASQVPFSFDVAIIKILKNAKKGKGLSIGSQVQIVMGLDPLREERGIIVTDRKVASKDFYTKSKRYLPDKVAFFEGADYGEELRTGRTCSKKYLSVYAGCAIMRGANFPEYSFMLVDCSQFIPQVALGNVKAEMTKEEKNHALAQSIKEQVIQIIGRVLRVEDTESKRVEGVTVQEKRKIVIALHGLPEELLDFTLEEALTHSKKEYVLPLDVSDNEIFMVIASIFEGKDPLNAIQKNREEEKKKEKKDVVEEYKKGALRKITLKKRKLLNDEERDNIKREEKKKKIIVKIKELTSQGDSKRTIQDKLNIRRLVNTDSKLFIEVADFLDECF